MPRVEVYSDGDDAESPLFTGEFDFVPRPGETISRDGGGYFLYYVVQRL